MLAIFSDGRELAAIGSVPRLIVPDNAKVAVIKACWYEPQVNRTYAEMAAHYGTAVLPTRPASATRQGQGRIFADRDARTPGALALPFLPITLRFRSHRKD